MKYADELKEKLCKEIDKIGKKSGDLTATELDYIYKMTDVVKNLGKIEMLEGKDGSYNSYRGGSYDDDMSMARSRSYNGSYNGSYDDGNSYARKGQHYVRAHYSRDDGMGMSNARDGRYSYADAKDHLINQLGEMMEDASPKVREKLKEAMYQLQDER